MIKHTFYPRTSLHFTSVYPLHFTTLHSTFSTSLHFWKFRRHLSKTLYVSSLIITFLNTFLIICDLEGQVASASAGSWFHSLIVLFTGVFTDICSLFPALILRSFLSPLRQQGPYNLSPILFHGGSPVYALNRMQI